MTLLERLAELSALRKVDGVGRNILEKRIALLCDRLEKAESDAINLEDNLTATQKRCAELVAENRRLRGIPAEGPATPSEGLNGPSGPSSTWPWVCEMACAAPEPLQPPAPLDAFDPLVGTTSDG